MEKLSTLVKRLEAGGSVYDTFGNKYSLIDNPHGLNKFLKDYMVYNVYHLDKNVEKVFKCDEYRIEFLEIEGEIKNVEITK